MTGPLKKEYLFVIIIILVGLLSFGLGRLSVLENKASEDKIQIIVPELSKIDTGTSNYAFVASINGAKYYPRGCKTANRIKSENRIYFKTGQDAAKSGFEPTTSC